MDTIDLYRDRVNSRSYELALLDVWLGSVDPDPFLLWHSSQRERGFNVAGYQNPTADQLIAAARIDGDVGRRLAALTAFQMQWTDDAASVVLASPVLSYAVPAEKPSARLQHLGEWHLKTTRVPGILR
jgi:peptide/nickel transport system substrate-binding protein